MSPVELIASFATLLGGIALIVAGFVVEGAADDGAAWLATRVGQITVRVVSGGRLRFVPISPQASFFLALIGLAVMTVVLMLAITLYAEFARVFLHGGAIHV